MKMETELLYQKDSYLKEWEARVISVSGEGEKEGKFVALDKTAFYPTGGGQPNDTGIIKRESDGKEFKVVYVGKFSGSVSHEVSESGLKEGDLVKCRIDWGRRYKLMRMHTGIHVLSEVIFRGTNALVTGGQLGEDKSRMDFAIENYDREEILKYIKEANEILARDLHVKVDFLPRDDALKIPQISKLAKGLFDHLEIVRVVSIGDFDVQADGGTHVHSTKEVGTIRLLKIDNRGKNNRRIYFELEDGTG
jgi:misacylated tRNA(Ala) deacylase